MGKHNFSAKRKSRWAASPEFGWAGLDEGQRRREECREREKCCTIVYKVVNEQREYLG